MEDPNIIEKLMEIDREKQENRKRRQRIIDDIMYPIREIEFYGDKVIIEGLLGDNQIESSIRYLKEYLKESDKDIGWYNRTIEDLEKMLSED